MRLKTLQAFNYLCLRAEMIEVPAGANAMLLAGPNGSGKSALMDGIRFVLTGELPRGLGYKKELPALITAGEKEGWFSAVSLDDEGRETLHRVGFKANASNAAPVYPGNTGPALAVSPQEFSNMEPAKRRRALFDMYGIAVTQAAILSTLAQAGHADERLAKVKTSLGAGFSEAAKRAKELASEARGAWQATTGETYGSQKGQMWRAAAPASTDDVGDPDVIAEQLAAKQTAAVAATRRRDSARNDEQLHQTANTTRALANELHARETVVEALDERIAAANEKQTKLRDAARDAGGWTAACPCCGKMLKSERPGKLVEYNPNEAYGPRAAAEAEAVSCELAQLTAERAKAMKKVDEARAAKLMLERLPARPSPEELAQYEAEARELLDEQNLLAGELETARAAVGAEARAAAATENAARYHADVEAYGALSQAIEALPAKFLSDTLDEVNKALAEVDAAFSKPVTMGEDMELRYGSIPYRLASESQRWRADLALGMALGARTGAVVLMDRFDMVQPSDRGAILRMLGAQSKVQVFIGATLKAAPELPEGTGVGVHWLGPKQ